MCIVLTQSSPATDRNQMSLLASQVLQAPQQTDSSCQDRILHNTRINHWQEYVGSIIIQSAQNAGFSRVIVPGWSKTHYVLSNLHWSPL